MYTFNAEIDLIILLVIMTVGCIIVQSIKPRTQYKWSQGDCNAHYIEWLNRRITAEEIRTCEIPDLGFSELHTAIMKPLVDSIKCRCFKCGHWYGKEYFTMQTWEMISPEDAICLSCVEPVEHIVKYYEHLYNMED